MRVGHRQAFNTKPQSLAAGVFLFSAVNLCSLLVNFCKKAG